MKRYAYAALAVMGVVLVSGCDDPLVPEWDIDLFFPFNYPDIALPDIAPTGQIPGTDVPFSFLPEQIDLGEASQDVLAEDVRQITGDFILATTTPVAGSLDLTIAPAQGDLFSTDPTRAVTLTIPILQTAGDTTSVTVDADLFRDEFGNARTVMYVQSRGTIRSTTGGTITVGANDIIQLRLNLTARIALVQ